MMISNMCTKITDYILNDFNVKDIIVAILAYMLIWLCKYALNKIKCMYESKGDLNISGYWITNIKSFIYSNDKNIEIYYIKQFGSKIEIKIQHYSEKIEDISILNGEGKMRQSFLGFYYATLKQASSVVGTGLLEIVETGVETLALKGNYYEDYSCLDSETRKEISNLLFDNNMMDLHKIKLSPFRKILFKINRPAFKSYSAVLEMEKRQYEF